MNIQKISNSSLLDHQDIKVSPLDLTCSEQSPCLACPLMNQDKERCLSTCERLKAYRNNQPYNHLLPSEV